MPHAGYVLLGKSLPELEELCVKYKQQKYRAKQIMDSVLQGGPCPSFKCFAFCRVDIPQLDLCEITVTCTDCLSAPATLQHTQRDAPGLVALACALMQTDLWCVQSIDKSLMATACDMRHLALCAARVFKPLT